MADGEDDEGCDICFDSYRSPKLLPCRHTFCEPCLKDYGESSCPQDLNEFIVCPLCRTQCALPSVGVEGFINNYFVRDIQAVDRCNVAYKHYPRCNFCRVKILPDDVRDHRCTLSSELASDESDDSDYTYEDNSLGFIVRFPLLRMRTKYKVDLECTFPLILEDDALITCIRTTHENTCYSIVDCSSTYRQHDSKGKYVGGTTITPFTTIMDMVYRKDNSVLFLTKNEISIVNGTAVKLFCVINNFDGLSMALFSDERVVVVGTMISVEKIVRNLGENSENTNEKQPEPSSKGKIVILSKDGKTILADLSRENCRPSVVAVNQVNDTICMSDSERKIVSVFLESGKVIGEFNLDGRGIGLLSFLPLFEQDGPRGINPAGVCFDPNGNILVVEQASASVLVLDPCAGFIGTLVTGAEGGFGLPFLIGCGSTGTIWVGDRGTIKVFHMAGYVNNM